MSDTADSASQARSEIYRLCAAGRPQDALQQALDADLHPFEKEQLLAISEVVCGEALHDLEMIAQGVTRFAALDADSNTEAFAFNRANGLLALWQVAVERLGITDALLHHRKDLQRSRDIYAAIGADPEVEESDRCQALTNRANSLDGCGRHLDALAGYNAAIEIRPSFGMALGNRGITLLARAAVAENHQHALGCEAVASLDAALAEAADVVKYGNVEALKYFENQRARVPGTPTHVHAEGALSDPYLEWCRRYELLLHGSHRCITADTRTLDALEFGGMTVGIDDQSQERHKTLQDALNALLQDFISVRYLAWASGEPETPMRIHAAEISKTASFSDSLTYARWGVATGVSVNSLAAATNLLDKVASVSHLYLDTGRNPSGVYFRDFWFAKKKKNVPRNIDPVIRDELAAGNYGLVALCDLAGELESGRSTPLDALTKRRNAATHRGVAVHEFSPEADHGAGWIDRTSAAELREAVIEQLSRARAALIYLTDLIRFREARTKPSGPLPELQGWTAETENADD